MCQSAHSLKRMGKKGRHCVCDGDERKPTHDESVDGGDDDVIACGVCVIWLPDAVERDVLTKYEMSSVHAGGATPLRTSL